MKRRLFTALSILSLLLAVAVAGLWVRSFWVHDRLVLTQPRNALVIFLAATNRLCVSWMVISFPYPTDQPTWDMERSIVAGPHSDNPFGSNSRWTLLPAYQHGSGYLGDEYAVGIPYWMLIALLLLLPGWWLWKWKIANRHGFGRCIECGYDLRASKDACPECGAVITHAHAK